MLFSKDFVNETRFRINLIHSKIGAYFTEFTTGCPWHPDSSSCLKGYHDVRYVSRVDGDSSKHLHRIFPARDQVENERFQFNQHIGIGWVLVLSFSNARGMPALDQVQHTCLYLKCLNVLSVISLQMSYPQGQQFGSQGRCFWLSQLGV